MTTLPFPPVAADVSSIDLLGRIELAPNNPAVGVIFLALLVLLNALFVAAEFALVKVHLSQLEDAVAAKRRGSRLALYIAKNIDTYLSVCQLGFTASTILLGDSRDSDPAATWSQWRYLYKRTAGLLPARHNGGGMMGLLDGHVSWFRYEKLLEAVSGRAEPWRYPP